MVKPALLALVATLGAAAAGCGRFQDPNVVVDLRTLAMRADPPDQVIDVDLTQPVMPAALLAQLVPTRVCALVADPAADRRLLWSMTLCSLLSTDRCDDDGPELLLGMGLSDDPETTVPEPGLCVTVMPDANCNVPQTKSLAGVAAKISPLVVARSPGDSTPEMAAVPDLAIEPSVFSMMLARPPFLLPGVVLALRSAPPDAR